MRGLREVPAGRPLLATESPHSPSVPTPSLGTIMLKESLVDLLPVGRLSTGFAYLKERRNCWAFSILHLLALSGCKQQCTRNKQD